MQQAYLENNDQNTSGSSESFNIRAWVFKMLNLWPVFLISLIVCLGIAFIYLKYTPPTYDAIASVMVKDEKKGAELMDNSMLSGIGLSSNNKLVENEIEILKSYDLIDSVVSQLQLFVSVREGDHIRKYEMFGNELPFRVVIQNPADITDRLNWKFSISKGKLFLEQADPEKQIPIEFNNLYSVSSIRFRVVNTSAQSSLPADTETTYDLLISPSEEITNSYIKRLSVEATSKAATVINLELKDINKKRGVQFLETLLQTYNGQNLQDKNRVSDNTVTFLSSRLYEVQNGLQNVEGSVEKFKSQNRVTELSADAQQYMASAQQVDIQKAQSQTQLNIVNALEKDLDLNQNNPQLVPSTLGIQEPSLGSLIERHNELVLQKERIELSSGPKNPLLIDLRDQIKEIRSRLLSNVRNLKQAYLISLKDVSQKDAELNSRIRNVPALEKKLVQITRNQNVQEQLYAFLLQKKEEAEITRASNLEDARTIVRARSLGKIAPRPMIVWALGLLLGLALPIIFSSIRNALNNTIGDGQDIANRVGVPLLGVVNYVSKFTSPIIIKQNTRSIVAEQIRNIRTALSYTSKSVKCIMVTSFQPGDGKSFVSVNLAASYALLDKKVVILEFDLRRPKISSSLELSSADGLSNILTGKGSVMEFVKKIPNQDGNLYLLSAGYLPPNPSELISGPNMRKLMDELRSEFDYIIIDTPPFSIVTDATLIRQYADITIVILRQNFTEKTGIKEIGDFAREKSEMPGYLILNGAGRSKNFQSSYTSYTSKFGKGYYIEE